MSNKDLIQFTDAAKDHFKQISLNADALGVRLSLSGGGCAGFLSP